MQVALSECKQCGAVGTIVDLGSCCRIRAMIAKEGGTGGALPEDIRIKSAWSAGVRDKHTQPFKLSS